jgi:hypothetical protein
MSIKTRRYRKRNNRSRITRKNKTTRRYKKQMKGGGLIKNETELKNSWDNKAVISWTVNDGVGQMTNIFRENAATGNIMPYEEFKTKIDHYLKQVIKEQKGAYIKENY